MTTPPLPTPADACCTEYAEMSRRSLLRGALVAGATMTFGSAVLTSAPASAQPARAVLVLLSLRGASDGLSLVVPHGDPVYYQARPRIAVPAETLLAKDGFFGLHPALAPMLPLWQAGKVAAVHASGLPVRNRSHFSAMEQLEDANPGSTRREGWLNRLIGADGITSPGAGAEPGRGRPARRALRAPALSHRGLRRGRPRLRRRPRRPEAPAAYVVAHAVGQRQDRARGPRCAPPSRPST